MNEQSKNQRFFKKLGLDKIWAIVKLYNRLKASDKLSLMALFVSSTSIIIGVAQFNETKKQFLEQQIQSQIKDSLNRIEYNQQISLIREKNQQDQQFYEDQRKADQKSFEFLRKSDSIQIANIKERNQQDRNFYEDQRESDLLSFEFLRRSDSIQLANMFNNQRLSVIPLLNGNLTTGKDGDKLVGFYIQNNGLGPALIKDIKIFYKGLKLENTSELMRLLPSENFCREGFGLTATNKIDTTYALIPGLPLFIISVPAEGVTSYSKFRNEFIWNVKIEVDYQSLYLDSYTYTWK